MHLKGNDTRTTLTAVSEEISTLDGAEKIISDNDAEWADDDTDGETAIILYVVLAAASVIIIVLVIILIIIIKRKKK